MILGVDDGGLVQMGESPLGCKSLDLFRVTDNNQVGYLIGKKAVGGFQCTLLGSFGEYDALLVTLGTRNNLA